MSEYKCNKADNDVSDVVFRKCGCGRSLLLGDKNYCKHCKGYWISNIKYTGCIILTGILSLLVFRAIGFAMLWR